MSLFAQARRAFHDRLLGSILNVAQSGIPSNADGKNRSSVEIASALVARIGTPRTEKRQAAQTVGSKFEDACAEFLTTTFLALGRLRPGDWLVGTPAKVFKNRKQKTIAGFDQFKHLAELKALAKAKPNLAAALGSDYLIKPDIVIARQPEPDTAINADARIVDADVAQRAPLRRANATSPILHASI